MADKKTKPFASKAQATHFYNEYKKGKLSYEDLMKGVHATKDLSALPDRIVPKTDRKTDVAIKGLI